MGNILHIQHYTEQKTGSMYVECNICLLIITAGSSGDILLANPTGDCSKSSAVVQTVFSFSCHLIND